MNVQTYKQKLLDALYAPYKEQLSIHPLAYFKSNTIVFGEGNPDAQLMIIGEAPGREEDNQGRPFVGRSGKLLTKALEAVGLMRSSVFITNIVKCRPPNNRKPLLAESLLCKNLLLINEIKIIRPKLICTLGAAALEGLLEQHLKITHARGKIITKGTENIPILPTYHPAYILRNPSEVKVFVEDLRLAANFCK